MMHPVNVSQLLSPDCLFSEFMKKVAEVVGVKTVNGQNNIDFPS